MVCTSPLWQRDKDLPPGFPAKPTGAVTSSGQVFSEKDIPLVKYSFLSAARFDLSPSLYGHNIFPACNIVPRVFISRLDFPEKDSLCTDQLAEEAEGAPGFKINFYVLET